MNAALLAAYAELDAARLDASEGRNNDPEIYAALRNVWKLENRLAERERRERARRDNALALYRFLINRRPQLQGVRS